MINKKGISPLIATILLIALVIAIALIVWFWYAEFLKQEIEKGGQKAIAEGECTLAAEFSVSSAECFVDNSDPDPSKWKYNVLINIRNEGKIDIEDFRVRIYGDTGSQAVLASKGLLETHSEQTSIRYDRTEVGIPNKLEIMPVITTDGITKTCTNKAVEVQPTGCT
ncbi:hypothetical protein J4471_02180 [Candidatus Woesearchaeota archaeon]|nr:hypothetical protein [Candidatus Woesearchaeota archaeon]